MPVTDPSPELNEELVEETRVVVETRVPGAAVETKADAVANAVVRAEVPVEVVTPEVSLVIPTDSPAANLAARSNIVPDGPGTVADFIE